MHYKCGGCDMSVKAPVCGKCDCELLDTTIDVDGQEIKVCQCESCEGMIKSPQCCGKDMDCCE